jgi:uncharacterized protein (TIGR02099 family)
VKFWLSNIIRKVFYVVVIFLFVFAILISLARISTPILNKHRAGFESWASQLLGRSVQIESVKARWRGFQPEVGLENVSILSADKKQVVLKVKELQVKIGLLRSLISRQLKPDGIAVSGVSLTVRQTKGMHFQIDGLNDGDDVKASSGMLDSSQDAIDWLFAQPHLSLSQVDFGLHRQNGIVTRVLLHQLTFVNKGEEHSISGAITLSQGVSSNVGFTILLDGDVKDSEHLKISLYLKLHNIRLSQIHHKFKFKGYQVVKGKLNGQFWLHWNNKQLNSMQALLNCTDLGFTDQNKQPHKLQIKKLAGNFLWIPKSGGWRLTADQVQFSSGYTQKIPGVENLSGTIMIEPDKGVVNIDSTDMQLDFGSLFSKKIPLDNLVGLIKWHKDVDNNWVITTNDITAVNDNIALSGQLALLLPNKDMRHPAISLVAGFDINDSQKAKDYSPVGVLHKNVADWLNQAFVGGDGVSGTVILRGPLKQFPFNKHEGTFVVDSKVRSTDLHYAPGWPVAKNIRAHLIFAGHSMLCDVTTGQVYNAKVKTMHAEIPYMGGDQPTILNLTGGVVGDAKDVLRYLKESPLDKTLGGNLAPLQANGDTTVNLKLSIPFSNPEKTKFSGSAQLSKVTIKVPTWGLLINDLNGKLFFTEKKLWSDMLPAIFLGQPANFKLETVEEVRQKAFTRIKFDSRVGVVGLEKNFNLPKTPYITGEIDYKAALDLRTTKNDKRQNSLSVSSDLLGISVDIPSPLNKSADQVKPFSMKVLFGGSKSTKAMLSFGERLDAALLYKTKKKKLYLYSANVHFGKGKARIQKLAGLYIDGFLPTFDWVKWQNYLKSSKVPEKQESGVEAGFKNSLRAINIKLGKIELLGQQFRNATFGIKPGKNSWSLGISSYGVSGQVVIPKVFPRGTITANFQKLFLQENKSAKKATINPGKIPSLNLSVDSFKYGKQYFGTIKLQTQANRNAMKIKSLRVNSKLMSTTLTGIWQKTKKGNYYSRVSGSLVSNNFNGLLNSYGMRPSLILTSGRMQFSLNWPGAIYNPSMRRMTGSLSAKFNKGQVVDLGASATHSLNFGRILSLLSVDRILKLDFSDLTKRGYAFSKMNGDFNFYKGKVSTQNLHIDGLVADINVKGSINLLAKSLNLQMIVIPNVTSSIPIIAGVAGGPIAGVAAFFIEKMIGKTVNKLTAYKYSVTGAWNKPKVVKVR